MSEYSVVVKKTLYLKNHQTRLEPRVTKAKLKVNKARDQIKNKKPSRFRCWMCGLNKGEVEFCMQCRSIPKSRLITEIN